MDQKPKNFLSIIKEIFKNWYQLFIPLLGIALLELIPIAFLHLPLRMETSYNVEAFNTLVQAIPAIIVGVLIYIVVCCLSFQLVSNHYQGRPSTLKSLAQSLKGNFIKFLGVAFLLFIILVVCFSLFFIPSFFLFYNLYQAGFTPLQMAPFVLILMLLLIPTVFILTRFSLIFPIIINEKVKMMRSLTRSNELIKGYTWHFIGYLIAFAVFSQIVMAIANFILPSIPTGSPLAPEFSIAQIFISTLSPVFTTSLYFNQLKRID